MQMKLYLHSGNFHADDVFCCAFLRLYGLQPETFRVAEITDEMRKEAVEKDRIENAKKMINDGTLPLEKISECSGLTIEKVRELAGDKSA